MSQNPAFGTAFGPGPVTVTITANDGSPYSANTTCDVTISIVDQTDPVIVSCASNQTVNLGAACNATLPDLTGDVSATDNCGVASITQNPLAGTTVSVDTPVTLTVTDTSGNTATCQATVFVQDVADPVITACASDRTVTLTGGCDALLPDLTGDVNATDNCGVASITQSPPAGTTITMDAVVTLTVTDTSGNTATCQATVFTEAPPAPVALCRDIEVPLNASGEATVLPEDVDNGSTVGCGFVQLALIEAPVTLTCDDLAAPVTVTLQVTDGLGNSSTCQASVTATDPLDACYVPPLVVSNDGDLEVTKRFGETHTFSVSVGGGVPPVSYQWRFDPEMTKAFTDIADGPLISGSETGSLTLGPLEFGQAGQYKCEVMDTALSVAESGVFTLYVVPGLPVAGGLALCLLAAAGAFGGAVLARKERRRRGA